MDEEIAIWNLDTDSCNKSFSTQRFGISSAEFTPDNQFLITGGGKGILKIWDINHGKCEREFIAHKSPVNVIRYCDRSRRIITGSGWGFQTDNSNDNSIKIWDLDTGKNIFTLNGHSGGVSHLIASSKEDFLISAGNDGLICLWDLRNGNQSLRITAHTGRITSIDLHHTEKYLISSGDDKHVHIWDLFSGQKVFSVDFDQPVWFAAFSKQGDCFLINETGNESMELFFIDWDLDDELKM